MSTMNKRAAIIEQGMPVAEAAGRLILEGWDVEVEPNYGYKDSAPEDRGWNPNFVPFYDTPDDDTVKAIAYGGKVMFTATR